MGKPVKKYFIAIVVPSPLLAQIEGIKQDLFSDYGLKGALRSPAHITLHRPFEWPEEREPFLIQKLSAFNYDKPLELCLKDFGSFEPRVIYVNVQNNPALSDLHTRLKHFAGKELGLLNEIEDMRGFHPHVTVAFRDLKKPLFYELRNKFSDSTFNERFTYAGFSLLRLERSWEELLFFPNDL